VVALAAAGEQARGGTLLVTLEPCRHTGRTAPCTDAILAAGIRRVLYAVADPFVDAAGGGDALRSAGVAVEGGVLRRKRLASCSRGLSPYAAAART